MADPKRHIKNPLFNPSVTGSTYEDISQNAVLLPAMEKPPPAVVNVTPEQLLIDALGTHHSQVTLQPAVLTPSVEVFQTPEVNEFPASQNQAQNTSISTSFANYFRIGGDGNKSKVTEQPRTAATIDNPLVSKNNSNAPPVPLFDVTNSTGSFNSPQPIREISPEGPVNTFRRSGLKRPVYAPVPGLNANPNPRLTWPGQIAPSTSVPGSASALPSASSVSPASSTSSIQDVTFSLNSQFKPINPQPPSFSSVKPNIPQPHQFSNLPYNIGIIRPDPGPVMSAIPATEALPASQLDAQFPAGEPSRLLASGSKVPTSSIYRPVYHHWFHRKATEEKSVWTPFSMIDSLALEHAFTSNELDDPEKLIATDGGRYDVNILRRQRTPVYWKGQVSEIRRCSWFYKNNNGDRRYVPYEENVAAILEEEYKIAFEHNQWHRKVHLDNGETVEFHASDVLVLFPPVRTSENEQVKPTIVKRGMDEFNIDEGEPVHIDHLLFMVHGIGSVCDLKFRTVEEVVDEFRSIALQLLQSHYKSSCEQGIANRVEVLPISWHGKLHSEETGVDEQLKKITLESIPKLRQFTNDTILDVLFYTSPMYCQTIISTVGDELNSVFEMFKQRNPSFKGGVSLGGHSLGSLILFDLLAHQHSNDLNDADNTNPDISDESSNTCPEKRKVRRRISYMMGKVGAGQPKINYPHLMFKPNTFFALGSPIGMFITVRGLDKLGENFSLPTCPNFFNIFHPYDPVAYRIEALINPELAKIKPLLIPHHKGRKRMHLELKETMARVGADLKQKVFGSMKSTWNSFYQLAMFHKADPPEAAEVSDINQHLQAQLEATPEEDEQSDVEPTEEHNNIPLGHLNNGRRIDYVLQEAPLEFINEYIFALTSHVCYWESEDTILMILKEIYMSMDIHTDSKIPQQTMTIERPPPSPKAQRQPSVMAADPTYPIGTTENLPPPPTSGFVKKAEEHL